MWRLPKIRAKHVLMSLALIGAGGVASVIAGWVGDSLPALAPEATGTIAAASPADAVASRFPSVWNEPSGMLLRTGLEPTGGTQDQRLAMFNPHPTYPAWLGMPGALGPSAPAIPVPDAQDAPDASGQPNTSPNALFNDAQIVAIRKRLNLTRNQQQYWPAVEAALRDIAWQRPASKGRLRTIDPNSRGVQRLKSAAAALVPSLSEEQKRELRSLAGLIGLQNLAAQF
jgi:hypothetical protein